MPTIRDRRQPVVSASPSQHELAIRALVDSDPRMGRNGFWREVANLIAEVAPAAESAEFTLRQFKPDAFLFDSDKREIHIYEVEVSHRIGAEKLARLLSFWEDWDADEYEGWSVRVFTFNPLTQSRAELPLADLYVATLEPA
jgi:hypothetical protein